jgi:GNAT superfamily N-acetyltransferase
MPKLPVRERQVWVASELLVQNRELFSALVAETYKLTDFIVRDYPNHCRHFWIKYVPGIFNHTREIIGIAIDDKLVGVVIAKKAGGEAKICTLFVIPEYRGCGIAKQLLERAFEYLGTSSPLISICASKLPLFQGLIERYEWQQTQVLAGHYTRTEDEVVFNGRLT